MSCISGQSNFLSCASDGTVSRLLSGLLPSKETKRLCRVRPPSGRARLQVKDLSVSGNQSDDSGAILARQTATSLGGRVVSTEAVMIHWETILGDMCPLDEGPQDIGDSPWKTTPIVLYTEL